MSNHDLRVAEFTQSAEECLPSFFSCFHPGSGSISTNPSAIDRQRRRATRKSCTASGSKWLPTLIYRKIEINFGDKSSRSQRPPSMTGILPYVRGSKQNKMRHFQNGLLHSSVSWLIR